MDKFPTKGSVGAFYHKQNGFSGSVCPRAGRDRRDEVITHTYTHDPKELTEHTLVFDTWWHARDFDA